MLPLGLAVFCSLFGDLTLYAVLATQREVVGISLGAVGIMLGINRLVRIPGNPLVGLLQDRRGRKPLFVLGMGIGALSVAGFGLLRGFWPFLIARAGWGIAWTLINVGGMTMVIDVSTPANRGKLNGFYSVWIWLGFAGGPLLGGTLVDVIGFQQAMLVCAGITGFGFLIAAVLLPETRTARLADAPATLESQQTKQRLTLTIAPRKWLETAKRLDPSLLRATGLTAVVKFVGEGVTLSTLSLLLAERIGESLQVGSLVLGISTVTGILLALRAALAGLSGPIAGHLSDTGSGRQSAVGRHAEIGRWTVIIGSIAVGIVGCLLLAWARALGLILLGVALGAISVGALISTLAAAVGDLVSAGQQGTAMGIYATAGDVGSTLGPFLAFALLSVVELRWVYMVCAIVLVLALGLARGRRVAAR